MNNACVDTEERNEAICEGFVNNNEDMGWDPSG